MILSKEISDTIKKDALNNIKRKNTVGEVNLYLYEEELPAKHILKAGPEDISIPKKTAFVFADKAPQYNWGHSCEYLSYDANTGDLYDKKEAEFPPINFFTDPKKFEAFHTPVKQIDTLEEKKLTMKPIPAITYALTNAPGNRYAILFSGMSNNRHVNDIEFLYRTLIDIYGFDPANIYVLNQNGTIDYYGYPHPVGNWPGDNTPYRMIVNSQGTKNDFENVLSELALKIKSEDLLFIHTNNHGGHDGQQSNICCYPNWDTYTALDFSAKLHSLPQFKVLMVMMEQCHSGGFLRPIFRNSPATWTHVAAACEEDKSSIGGANFDPFALDWIAGITGHYTDGTGLSQEVDVNRDGRISAVEAFAYADTVHDPYDTPVSNDSPRGYGKYIFLGTKESANIIWFSPLQFQPDKNLTIKKYADSIHIYTTNPGDLQWIDLPLVLPSNVKIKKVMLYYKLSNSKSFISQVRLTETTKPSTALVKHDDGTDLTSTTATHYYSHVGALQPNGAITLCLRLNFADVSDRIEIGGIGIFIDNI